MMPGTFEPTSAKSTKTIYFIGDDHSHDLWITTGWNFIKDEIKPPFVLLLEMPLDSENTITGEDLAIILEEKPSGADIATLGTIVKLSALAYGFDAGGGQLSPARQKEQAANINYFVNKFKGTKDYNIFVVVVGYGHLVSNPLGTLTWPPLQSFFKKENVIVAKTPLDA